jgi:uncharacterized membrane protein
MSISPSVDRRGDRDRTSSRVSDEEKENDMRTEGNLNSRNNVSERLLYWIPTGLVALFTLLGGVGSVMRGDSTLAMLHHLGYPEYFAVLLGIAKILGAIALVAPVSRTLREWAYAGLTFDVIAAIVSIGAVGDPIGHVAFPVVFLGLVQLSFWVWRRRGAHATVESAVSAAAPVPALS